MPVVSAPVVVLPRHQVTTDEVLDMLAQRYPDHPRMPSVRKAITASTVRTRWYSRPPARQFDTRVSVARRLREHFRDSLDLAERAARQALLEAGLDPLDVDGLVVTSTTGYAMPGIDIPLVERLGLPASVRRVPVTQIGCGGGAFALAKAFELVQARPGSTYLVVCSDMFSHYLHPADTGMDGMIFKGLMGDAAGACVVRPHADGPRMELTGSFEYVQPGSYDIVGTTVDGTGLHLYNAPRLLGVIPELASKLARWLELTAPAGADPVPGFVVSHNGGPRIMDAMVQGLGCDPRVMDAARDSLRDLGNVGGVSVLDVLERTYAKPPADEAAGVLFGVGPGVCLYALKCVWHAM
ncbi:hypothetical protein [Streptomyces cylindrosporus]|uniref:Type III polyketide synthase n=1 Tax=Streptomyces cylindrosporus TaxID=2927583 RepID=A0ABS9Y239_9ACTN|nr:hypothetical protein [Streptomyces cylindrosporus]MCI3271283.1 hypothetical protein [Streptomyces cylindrosporus]